MKAFFFPIYTLTPHFETELELIIKHRINKDEVFILKCTGELKTCLMNPYHKKSICELCISRVNKGLKLINFPKNNIIILPLKNPNFDFLPQSFSNLDDLLDFKYDNLEFGAVAASNIFFLNNRDYDFDISKYQNHIILQLKNIAYLYINILEIFKNISPDLVYVFNGRFSESAACLFACKKLKITYFTHERAGQKNRYSLWKNTKPHNVEYVNKEIIDFWETSTNPNKFKIGEQWFIENRKGVEQGWYSFIKLQRNKVLPKDIQKKGKVVTIFNSSIEEYLTISENKNLLYKDENDGIRRIAESLKSDPNIQLYLRMHPNLLGKSNAQVREIKEIEMKFTNLSIIPPESPVNTYDLIEKSDIIVSFGSTVGIEAVFWNKPSILAGRAAYEQLDVVYVPKSHEELIEMIKSDLPLKDKKGALKYGYWQKDFGIPFKFFKQTGVSEGLFLGHKISPSIVSQLKSLLLKINEINNSSDLILKIKKLKTMLLKKLKFSKEKILWT